VLPFFRLIHWFFSLSNFVIPSKCLKNFISAAAQIITMSLSLTECYWRSSAVLFVLSSQFHWTSLSDLSGLLCCFSLRYVPHLQVWIFILL
jgi:hypothetical protein